MENPNILEMTIELIKQLMSNRIATLGDRRGVLIQTGDIETLEKLDKEIADTQSTLDQLNTL